MLFFPLYFQNVISQDEQGNLTLGDEVDNSDETTTTTAAPDASSVIHSLSPEDNEDESACVICLEPFRVGDCVSWSRNSRELNCLHVFHSDCILPWLEEKRHDDCPSCRSTLILQPPDGDLEKNEDEDVEDEEQHEEDLNASSSNVFVIMHGLVSSAARRANYSLIGKDLEIETADDPGPSLYSLYIPSPLRRVMSHGSHISPRRPSLGDSVRGLFRRRLSFSRSTDEDVEHNGDASLPNNHMEVLQRPFSLRRSASEGLGTHTGVRRSFAMSLPPLPPPSSGVVRRRGVLSSSTLNTHYNLAAGTALGHTATMDSSEHSEEEDLEWLHTNRASWQTGGSFRTLDDILDVPEGAGDIESGEGMLTPNQSTSSE
jgi:hypothetical protein